MRNLAQWAGLAKFASLSFLLLLWSFIFSMRLFSKDLTPFQTWCLQAGLSEADCSQVSGSMWQSFSDALRVSLNLSFGRPLFLLPSASSLYKSCLGRRLSSIRKTWPAHLSWHLFKREKTLSDFAVSSTSVSGILSSHLMCSMLRIWNGFVIEKAVF